MSSSKPSSGGALEDTSKRSWADEVNSPTVEDASKSFETLTVAAPNTTSSQPAAIPQLDGAAETYGGSGLDEPTTEVNIKLADMQADPNNPLYSAKTFEELNLKEDILKGVIKMNFRKPSKVQERTLPLLLLNPPTNLIGQSQSGTGKTAAFVLNILSRIDLSTEQSQKTPQALVLAPSRELARQIVHVVETMGQYMEGLKVEAIVPVNIAERGRKIEASVAVGTPGTVLETIRKRNMVVSGLKVLVLDEADNMLDQQGLGDQSIRVKRTLPNNIQIVLFSATFPEAVVQYAQSFAPKANEMTLQHEDLTVAGIKQIYLDCDSDAAKYEAVVKLYGMITVGSSIIFVKTRETALEIERRMTNEGHKVVSLIGGFEGTQRDVIIDAFRNGRAKVLITTNVLARGIDVQTVSLVINYNVPDRYIGNGAFEADPQTYLHRIGRTGRFGRVGVAVTLISSRKEWKLLMDIQQYFNAEISKVETDDWDDVEETVRKIVKSSRAGPNFKGNAE